MRSFLEVPLIRPTPELASFERRYARERGRDATYAGALEVFTALWVEAAALNPDFRADWREDIEPDLAIARALNGLPPCGLPSLSEGLRE